MVKEKIVVGSRGSKLALIQTESVVAKLREINPRLKISISKLTPSGDRDKHTRLDRMGGVGAFVNELEEALLDGMIDLAVHSLKDLPTKVFPRLYLAAVTERADPRDVLVSRAKTLAELPPGSRIGTGSLRRATQLTSYRPDLKVCGIRGNIDTRLRKVSNGEMDGVILAAAAIKRLGWEAKVSEYLPVEHFLPAVGQGALAIEMRLSDAKIAEIISPINHLSSWQCITAERSFLNTLGGSCSTPIAALGTVNGAILKLKGMVADISGKKILYDSEEGNVTSPEQTGIRLAEKMLEKGGSEFIIEAKRR